MNRSTKYDSLTDEQLLSRYRQYRDNHWLGVLLERYTTLLLGVAMKYLKDTDQAADAVQQVFLKTLTSLPEEPVNNFKGWLYILMRNHCLRLLQEQQRTAGVISLAAEDPEPGAGEQAVDDPELVREAIAQLKGPQQTAVRMFYIEGKNYRQIMEATGYNFMQVKSYIQNGKRNLKQILLTRLNRKS